MEQDSNIAQDFIKLVDQRDSRRLRDLLNKHPELRRELDRSWFGFGKTALVEARHDRKTVEVLLEFGADIEARSDWEAGSYGVLNENSEEMVHFLLSRGAQLDIHTACEHGWLQQVEELLDGDPALAKTRGPDGQLPLHYAKTVDVAKRLLDGGAELDARCLDHNSTATQYCVSDRPGLCRYLISRGAWFDMPVATVLGDLERVKECVKADPESINRPAGRGKGDINRWKLGDRLPTLLAGENGHQAILDYLCSLLPLDEQLIARCWSGDREAAEAVLEEDPQLIATLKPSQLAFVAHAAWDRRVETVKLMLDLGFDVNTRGDHQATPLARAALRGFRDVVKVILPYNPDSQLRDEFGGVALTNACWGAINWRDPKGDYLGTLQLMVDHGCQGHSEKERDGDHGYGHLAEWLSKEGHPELATVLVP